MDRYRLRSPLGRAIGLGSAKAGFEHWWMERVTAVALMPLTVWFAASVIGHGSSDYETFIRWLGSPLTAVLMILLLVALFWHAALGFQVVIEDYVHSGAKVWALLTTRFLCFALAAGGIFAVLLVALRAPVPA